MEVNQIKCVRVVNVKGITGSSSVNDDLIQTFRKSIERLYTKQEHAINDASEFSKIISDEQQSFQNPYYLESTAYYMFHKLLCAENYGLGKQVRDFIDRITAQLQDESLVTLRQSMASINTFINSIVETLFQSFNFGKQETIEIMPYCRISIEKQYQQYLVYGIIKPRYQKLFIEQNAKFRERTTEKALEKLNLPALDNMQELRVNEATAELNRIQISQFPRGKAERSADGNWNSEMYYCPKKPQTQVCSQVIQNMRSQLVILKNHSVRSSFYLIAVINLREATQTSLRVVSTGLFKKCELIYMNLTKASKVTTFPKGSCQNCGAKDHNEKFCLERPKKSAKVKKIEKVEEKLEQINDLRIPKSKYPEDCYIGQHKEVWGSYWNEVIGWGFACCYSNSKTEECLGEKGKRKSLTKEYLLKRQIEETPLIEQDLTQGPLNMNELYRMSKLREGAPVDQIVLGPFVKYDS